MRSEGKLVKESVRSKIAGLLPLTPQFTVKAETEAVLTSFS